MDCERESAYLAYICPKNDGHAAKINAFLRDSLGEYRKAKATMNEKTPEMELNFTPDELYMKLYGLARAREKRNNIPVEYIPNGRELFDVVSALTSLGIINVARNNGRQNLYEPAENFDPSKTFHEIVIENILSRDGVNSGKTEEKIRAFLSGEGLAEGSVVARLNKSGNIVIGRYDPASEGKLTTLEPSGDGAKYIRMSPIKNGGGYTADIIDSETYENMTNGFSVKGIKSLHPLSRKELRMLAYFAGADLKDLDKYLPKGIHFIT